MVRVNMGAPVEGDAPPGVYLASPVSITDKVAASGTAMLVVVFECERPDAPTFKQRDNILLGGKGWGMGRAKLSALGVASDYQGDLDPVSLIGKPVYLHLSETEYKGRKRLEVDISKGTHSGYSLDSDADAKAAANGKAVASTDDETPF